MVIALPEPPDSLNPLYARTWSARAVQGLFLAGLWRLDDSLAPHPELAAGLPTEADGTIADGGRTFTIRLRPEATWSDGQPLTADDLLFTYQMAVAPENSVVSRFPYDRIEGIVAVDAHTVQVRFGEPFAPWPSTLFSYVLPRHVLEPVFAREGTLDRVVWNRQPTVGSGPFVFAGQEGDVLHFVANPLGNACCRVAVRVLPQVEERLAAVRAGEVDLVPLLWPEHADGVSDLTGARVVEGASGLVETLVFNFDPATGHPALQQEAVRRAIGLALDRPRLCDLLAPGRAQPAFSLWAGTVFESPAASAAFAGQANDLLDGAGWRDRDGDGVRERDGLPLTLRYAVPASGVQRGAVTAALGQMLARVGIRLQPVVWGAEEGWDLAEWASVPPGYPDPDDPRWLCVGAGEGGHNPTRLCDEDLDSLLYAQAETAEMSVRVEIFYRIEALNAERVWWVPLCRLPDLWLVGEEMEDIHPWRGDPFWDFPH